MPRPISKLAEGWWDYTTLDPEILADAAKLTVKDLQELDRPGFTVKFYETIQEFYSAQALEYIHAWRRIHRRIIPRASAVPLAQPNSFRLSP